MVRGKHAVPVIILMGVIAGGLAALPGGGPAAATSFNPTFSASVADNTAGVNSDVTMEFEIPVPDANFFAAATYVPNGWGVADDASVPDGAIVGELDSISTLGLLDNPCTTALPVTFELMDAATDTTTTVPYDDCFPDSDSNGLPDCVDGYPDFLTIMFPGLTAHARYYGQAFVAGTEMMMNLVIFAPGTPLGVPSDPGLGYPSVAVLNNPVAPPQPSAVTDFCTPLESDYTVLGLSEDNPDTAADEHAYPVMINPMFGGTYSFGAYAHSLWDADDDGIENNLDTCPFDPNEGDPRVSGSGDDDGDGIDNVCDPDPAIFNSDHDGDGFMNRQDNCPLVANADNLDSDGDGIGDACDPHPGAPDGHAHEVFLTSDVEIVGGPPPIHDVKLVALLTRGRNVRNGATKTHWVVVRNVGEMDPDEFEVSLEVYPIFPGCHAEVDAPTKTVSVEAGRRARVPFEVTYSCTPPLHRWFPEFLLIADADDAHGMDANPANDLPKIALQNVRR